MTEDPRIEELAEVLGMERVAAIGMRAFLYELAIDVVRSSDLTTVSSGQWALLFGIPGGEVPQLIDAFVAAGFLNRDTGRLHFVGWDEAVADENHRTFRSWMRSNPGGIGRLAAALERPAGA